jgi:hypothetical protein
LFSFIFVKPTQIMLHLSSEENEEREFPTILRYQSMVNHLSRGSTLHGRSSPPQISTA